MRPPRITNRHDGILDTERKTKNNFKKIVSLTFVENKYIKNNISRLTRRVNTFACTPTIIRIYTLSLYLWLRI